MSLGPDSVYPVSNPPFVQFPSRRSVVHSTNGMVACTQPLAAEAGQRILKMGGNCADAAVAVAAALNITEPASTGIGGDMFCLFFDAATRKVHALNGSGRSAKSTTLASVRADLGLRAGEKGSIPMTSALAVTVPGAAAGWVDTVEKFGSGKVTMEQILTPAIELGEKGYAVSEISAGFWSDYESRIRNASPNFAEMLRRDVKSELFARAPRAGELFRNPNLARTFRTLATKGKKGFYSGRIAQALVDVVKLTGGHLSMEDLKEHMETGSQETRAVSLKFSGQGVGDRLKQKTGGRKGFVELWEHPPNGQGIVALMALGIVQQLEAAKQILPFAREDHNSVPYLHALIESLRIAFADANWWVCDPDPPFAPKFAPEDLVKPDYLKKRSELFRKDGVCNPHHGDPEGVDGTNQSPAHNHSDTVYFCVTDAAGNGISFINSNYGGFGTCIIPAGCGFTLQNRGANFALGPADHPNIYAGGKRPYHTIIPALLTIGEEGVDEGRELLAVYGVMGGFMQPQGHVQVLLNMEAFGMNAQQALDAPRVCVGAGMPGEAGGATEQQGSSLVYVEEGIDDDVVAGLKKLGHSIKVLRGWERGMFGRGQVIRQSWDDGGGRGGVKTRIWSGGSDLRGDGCVLPS